MTTQFIQRRGLIDEFFPEFDQRVRLSDVMLASNRPSFNIHVCDVYATHDHRSWLPCLNSAERRILRGSLFQHPVLSEAGLNFSRRIIVAGERGIDYWSNENFRRILQIEVWGTPEFQSLSRVEQSYLRSLAQFYMRQMRRRIDQMLPHSSQPSQLETQRRYSSASPTQRVEDPATCSHPEDWVQKELIISGTEFIIPVFIERSEESHWAEYQENLQEAFSLLKRIVSPEVLNGVLRARSLSDFSIAIGSGNQQSPIDNCGLHGNGGFAHPTRHQLILRRYYGTLYPATNQSGFRIPGYYNPHSGVALLFHEFSHLIDYSFLNHELRANLTAWRNWMHAHYSHSTWSRIHADPYLPLCSQNADYSPHCLDFSYEIFAALFETYGMESLFGPHLYQEGDQNPLVAQHRAAQVAVMRNLFQADGFHPEALSLENIARAYQAAGIPLTVEELSGHERTLWSANVDFHPALQVRFPRQESPLLAGLGFTLRVRGTRPHTPNWLFGFNQTGFYPWGGNSILQLGLSTPDEPEWHAELHLNGGLGYGAPDGDAYPLIGAGASFQYLFLSSQRYVDFGFSLNADWVWNPTQTHGHSLQLSAGFLISPRVLSF